MFLFNYNLGNINGLSSVTNFKQHNGSALNVRFKVYIYSFDYN